MMKKFAITVLLCSLLVPSAEGAWITCAAVGAGGAVVGAPWVVSALGFGAAGVAKGSAAAAAQSWLFGAAVPAGGWFASMTSAGAAGMSWLSSLGVGSTITVICTALP